MNDNRSSSGQESLPGIGGKQLAKKVARARFCCAARVCVFHVLGWLCVIVGYSMLVTLCLAPDYFPIHFLCLVTVVMVMRLYCQHYVPNVIVPPMFWERKEFLF